MEIIIGKLKVRIDDDDVQLFVGKRLKVKRNKNTFYVLISGKFLHRLVMKAQKGQIVDHISGDGLDNRRSNLRFCTVGQNRQRALKSKQRSSSGYLGVSRHNNRWKAVIWHQGVYRYLGTYAEPEVAARAYDTQALALFGQYAKTNF